jgi:putative ABC transport system permease protein
MVVPQNFMNTLQSPDFVSYMGAGRSDIRLDIAARQGEDIAELYQEIDRFLSGDNDVTAHAVLVTAEYRALNADGAYENIRVEIGDFSAFPINYGGGRAPISSNEIALSHMNASEFGVGIGDTLILLIDGQEQALTVSGIYSDITNGGRTAKGLLPYSPDNILWMVVNINISDGVPISEKIAELSAAFPSARVTDMADWINQTMGGLIGQLSIAAWVGFGLGLIISGLITAMFFKMLIAKDASQIAVMHGLGISYRDIRLQYLTRAVIILIIGVVVGSFAAVSLGQGIAGLLISGISSMRFIINPLISYAVSPLMLALVVGITIFIDCTAIRKIDISCG